jgi:hypothetical protein
MQSILLKEMETKNCNDGVRMCVWRVWGGVGERKNTYGKYQRGGSGWGGGEREREEDEDEDNKIHKLCTEIMYQRYDKNTTRDK